MKQYLNFWKRSFDYKGTSPKKEYAFGLIATAALAAAALILSLIFYFNGTLYFYRTPITLFWLFTLLHFVPMLSLTVRRLRDKGKSLWWTTLIIVIGIGWVILSSYCLTDGYYDSFFPWQNTAVSLYACPDPIGYDPSDNILEDVYGPPEIFENDPVEDIEESESEEESTETEIKGSAEESEDEGSAEDGSDDEGQNADFIFEPEINIQPLVYGPPEMFEQDALE